MKITIKTLLVIAVSTGVMYSAAGVGAELVVVNESGSLYTIKGTDFGNSPETILHEDFDEGVSGQELKSFDVSSNNSQNPVYSDLTAVTGKISGSARFPGKNYNSTAEFKALGGLDKVYLSYYVKVEHQGGDLSRNIKLARLTAGYDHAYIQGTGITLFPNNGGAIFYNYTGDSHNQSWITSVDDGDWHRIEHELVLSNPAGASNGTVIAKIDNKVVSSFVGAVTESTGKRVEWLTLPYYVAHDSGGDYNMYYDNVVVSKNPARVEVCNVQLYSECIKPVVARVKSWNNGEIKVSHETRVNDYFFVFNSKNNLLNEKGIAVCLACPVPPQDLSVN